MSNDPMDRVPEPTQNDLEQAARDEELADVSDTGVADPIRVPDDEAVEIVQEAEEDSELAADTVAEQDLSVNDRIQDGAMPEDLERGNFGRNEMTAGLEDPSGEESIDDRVRQELPEEGFDVVPGGRHDEDYADEIGEAGAAE